MRGPLRSRMNTRIRIEKETRTEEQGYHSSTWTLVAVVYAAMLSPRTQDEMIQDRRMSRLVVTFGIQYRTDITQDMRVVRNGVVFEITGILPDLDDHSWVMLECIQEMSNG
jgi:SPP1 family predicted phage head-tail adaptor